MPSKHGTGMTRNSAGQASAQCVLASQRVMRCEAINAPSTRLDLRLTSSRGPYSRSHHCSPPLARLKHSCQPVRFHFGLPDGYSPRLRIISIYSPTLPLLPPPPSLLHGARPISRLSRRTRGPRPGMDLLALFRDLFSP